MVGRFFRSTCTALYFHSIRWWREYVLLIGTILVISASCLLIPRSHATTVSIPRGAPLEVVAHLLSEGGVISHPLLFSLVVRALGEAEAVNAGLYTFNGSEHLLTVVRRLVRGDTGFPPVKITFPEGLQVRQMTRLVLTHLPLVSEEEFLTAARPYEGYLFPDTYFFPIESSADDVVRAMRTTFTTRLTPLSKKIEASERSLQDIITMASLIEGEAKTPLERRLISGILWNRIEREMPLQVDAVFGYIVGKDAYAPTFEDLAIDSPYNTYRHKGLPPGPISNPGFDAIEAALSPTKTDYLYYLTGTDGVTRYAKTFADHQQNRKRYLD